ncbi:protein TAPETUM DETERMINANT 1-like [Phoenix dactylifera]|uniref:Protein TAPETUM DETERMINANT 1-like n=1 Tax=Phoenix dactylifera TaxID=42345 RepID=A0A8B9AWB7_PHODC|nr:protein TAPETUM DETERMINANT 1-like [Phoenix dactylifera]
MAAVLNLLAASFVFLCILKAGSAHCTLSDIAVSQSKTGANVQGKPEYQVVIANNCICSQSSLLLKCSGFNSAEPVDPYVFKPVGGGQCSVNNEQPVFKGSDITFKYSWDSQFDLSPVSSLINCS